MKGLVKGALLAAGTALAISAAPASAAAATSGTETLSGTIVFVALPGTSSFAGFGNAAGRPTRLVPGGAG